MQNMISKMFYLSDSWTVSSNDERKDHICRVVGSPKVSNLSLRTMMESKHIDSWHFNQLVSTWSRKHFRQRTRLTGGKKAKPIGCSADAATVIREFSCPHYSFPVSKILEEVPAIRPLCTEEVLTFICLTEVVIITSKMQCCFIGGYMYFS